MFFETHLRTVIKTVSWRLCGTAVTSLIVWGFTRRLEVALAVGGLEIIGKSLVFFVHERIWNKVHLGRRQIAPSVIWLTGLSGAGKSTIALELVTRLQAQGLRVEHLDGDEVRSLFPNTGFDRSARIEHVKRIGHLASILERNGVTVVVSLISPYLESRRFVRDICRRFYEIYVSTPLDVCERRDVKGLYSRARRGEIRNFTGIDDPYETPENPNLVLDTQFLKVAECVDAIVTLQSQEKKWSFLKELKLFRWPKTAISR